MAVYKEDFVDIELNSGNISRSFMNRSIGEGDINANRFGVHVFRNGEPEQLNGSRCEGYFIRSTGETVPISGAVNGNSAWVDLPAACYAYEGQFALAIKLIGGTVTGTMRIVDGVVVNTTTGAVVDPGTIIPSIEQLIALIDETVQSIPPEYDNFVNAFLSRRVNFDLTAMYGSRTNSTYNGITYTWNGDTCTVSGTATALSFNNFLNLPVPSNATRNPFGCHVEISGSFQNVTVNIYAMANESISETRELTESGNIQFTQDCTSIIARLNVANGLTASGTIKVSVSSQDPIPFGMRAFERIANGTNLNTLKSGMYVLSDTGAYTNSPPDLPCFLMVYEHFNTVLQIALPYEAGYNGTFVRVKQIDGTWQNWNALNVTGPNVSRYASNNNIDIDDIRENGFYLLYDAYTYTNLPFQGNIGFLFVFKTNSAQMQIAIPFTPNAIYMRRNLRKGTWSGWEQASGTGGNTYNITNEYTFPEYSQSVSVTATPTITTDTNNYLAPTGDATDRTADILTMLSTRGICRLGPGDYYVNNLQMPNGSSIIGSGHATRIRLAGTSDGYAIKIGSRCLVQDVRIAGAESDITFGSNIGGRHGILWQGDYTQHTTAPDRSMVSNVWIYGFSGGGITCYDTGYGTSNALEVVNGYILNCWAGINISYWSEFHKFTNVRCGECRIGCVNNGGNNIFVNCDFSSNLEIAMLMDNSQGQSPNHTHGSCIGCVFNHTAHAGTANSGVGIEMLNCDRSGFVFDGCQIFFSRIHLEDTDGIVFNSCNFGYLNCDIEISGGGAVLFLGNMHQEKPTISITGNPNVHFANCYVKTTGESVTP